MSDLPDLAAADGALDAWLAEHADDGALDAWLASMAPLDVAASP
jgi:hypothetical protein